MSLLVTGSIGIDTIETPHGRANDTLGGSAVYFAVAASLFNEVRMVAVVGDDFDARLFEPLGKRRIDTSGVERRTGSRTFRWHGRYAGAMNEAETVDVKLNVLAERAATIPPAFADSPYVFLANTHPAAQFEMARQMSGSKLIVCDTMNLWIQNESQALRKTLAAVNGVVLNEGEARLLTGKSNLVAAGREILAMGPRFAIIKKGEHGSLMVSKEGVFVMPAYPTTNVVDPTGCGDCFAGAMMGYLAASGRTDIAGVRSAMARGSVVASFVIESFSITSLHSATAADVESRLRELRAMAAYE
ncbi:MAG: sugar kinase [Planctomycetia bacterium]|nr:MAG: sugar kinase [Planctomycetia bacterium]